MWPECTLLLRKSSRTTVCGSLLARLYHWEYRLTQTPKLLRLIASPQVLITARTLIATCVSRVLPVFTTCAARGCLRAKIFDGFWPWLSRKALCDRALRRESLGVCHGQSTVIGRVLRVDITENNVCLAAYYWQTDFSVLRQCSSSGTASDSHTPYKARPSQNWPKLLLTVTSTRFS